MKFFLPAGSQDRGRRISMSAIRSDPIVRAPAGANRQQYRKRPIEGKLGKAAGAGPPPSPVDTRRAWFLSLL